MGMLPLAPVKFAGEVEADHDPVVGLCGMGLSVCRVGD